MTPEGKTGFRRYGQWAGNPAGNIEDAQRCVEIVSGGVFNIVGQQCSRNRGFGPYGEYCKQHAKRYATDETMRKAGER